MIEVEAKVAVKSPDKIRKKAKILGKFLGKENKVDDYYTLERLDSYPKKSLRVGKASGYHIVNFKQAMNYEEGVHAKKEVEFKVSDIDNFLKLIEDFGFKRWLRKEKECEIFEIRKNLRIELNHVKKLGWFAEIECLVNNANEARKARKEVLSILEQLGFTKKDTIKAGHTKQLWNKMH